MTKWHKTNKTRKIKIICAFLWFIASFQHITNELKFQNICHEDHEESIVTVSTLWPFISVVPKALCAALEVHNFTPILSCIILWLVFCQWHKLFGYNATTHVDSVHWTATPISTNKISAFPFPPSLLQNNLSQNSKSWWTLWGQTLATLLLLGSILG